MSVAHEDFDVGIVGYGPVGKLLGVLLAQKGWKVGVFEKWPSAYPLPRAVVYDDEIARMFQSVCDLERLGQVVTPVSDYYDWCNAAREVLLRIDWSVPGVSGWPGKNFFSQPQLEKVLDLACQAQPNLKIHMGHEAIQLVEHGEYVELVVRNQAEERKTIMCKYLVGCDGANSFVRKNMEITVTDLGFSFDWLILDVIPHEEREWKPMNWQLCDPARPTTIVSGGPGRRRWEFMKMPGETKDFLNTEETAWRLLKPWGIRKDNATLERHAVYTFRASWADCWNKGRLILAGDAAHLTPPFLGQGMCSGLRDAKNLAWKLDLVLANKVAPPFLDTYTAERKPHTQTLIDMAIYLGEMICVIDPEKAAARDQAFFNGSVPPFPEFPILTEGILHRDASGKPSRDVGKLSIQGEVSNRGRTGLFDDIIGQGWTILSTKANPYDLLADDQKEFLKELDTRVVHISLDESDEDAVFDVKGMYTKYFEENQYEVIITRPDYYLFATGSRIGELPSLVENLRAQFASFSVKQKLL